MCSYHFANTLFSTTKISAFKPYIYIYMLILFNSHFYIKYPSVWPQQQKLKPLMVTWINPFKILMVAKISTSNHSTVPLSCIMYLKNITIKYMHGVNWQLLARSPTPSAALSEYQADIFLPANWMPHYRHKHRYLPATLRRHVTFVSQCHLTYITETINSGAEWRRNFKFGFLCTYRCHTRDLPNYRTLISSILN